MNRAAHDDLQFSAQDQKMKCLINGQEYQYINNALEAADARAGYFRAVQKIYGLEFEKWYRSGYWDNRFVPYVLMQNGNVVSSVAICINDINWQNERKRYVQISTVMTLPGYRNKGLNRFLMEAVLNEWVDKCDAIYLLANDSVVDFYPKFGFEVFKEFQYSKPITKSIGTYRKLNMEDADDWNLMIKKYELGNPFSALTVENRSQFVFHCNHSFSNDIYYVDNYDAVAIVRHENSIMNCYDIYAAGDFLIDDILNILANKSIQTAYLGFTPKLKTDYKVVESQEPDTHLFVLKGKENIFKDNEVMFPVVSRA